MILAGDIGANKTELALYEHEKGAKEGVSLGEQCFNKQFLHHDYTDMRAVFAAFFAESEVLEHKQEIYAVCLSIAGPIDGHCFTLSNSPWEGDKKSFCKEMINEFLFCPVPVALFNDMEAIGYSIFPRIEERTTRLNLVSLNPQQTDSENHLRYVLVLLVEGVGQALWYWDEKHKTYAPFASEGGHADFAARTVKEIGLLQYLHSIQENNSQAEPLPVSYEQVLSVHGLVNILHFIATSDQQALPESLQQLATATVEEKVAAIVENALQNNTSCKQAIDLYLSILGGYIGNLVLTYRTESGGVYITGFILVKMIEVLQTKNVSIDDFFAPFMKSLAYKEKDFSNMAKKAPVSIVCKSGLPIEGVAQRGLLFVTRGFFDVNRKLNRQ